MHRNPPSAIVQTSYSEAKGTLPYFVVSMFFNLEMITILIFVIFNIIIIPGVKEDWLRLPELVNRQINKQMTKVMMFLINL